jgi:nucleotide-binding universal stress UspA family protein
MTQMETIQIEVSSELARRLRPYQTELPRILEWGLRHVEVETGAEPAPTRADVLAALRSTGILVELDPAIAARYRAGSDQQGRIPVQVEGKPLSEMIIEERDRQWTNSQ